MIPPRQVIEAQSNRVEQFVDAKLSGGIYDIQFPIGMEEVFVKYLKKKYENSGWRIEHNELSVTYSFSIKEKSDDM